MHQSYNNTPYNGDMITNMIYATIVTSLITMFSQNIQKLFEFIINLFKTNASMDDLYHPKTKINIIGMIIKTDDCIEINHSDEYKAIIHKILSNKYNISGITYGKHKKKDYKSSEDDDKKNRQETTNKNETNKKYTFYINNRQKFHIDDICIDIQKPVESKQIGRAHV